MVSTSSLKTLQRNFLWPNVDLDCFECLAYHSPKMVWSFSLKSLQKTEKCSFQMPTTFVFELKVPSKPFSKKFPRTKFWFKQLWTLCITFPGNAFNFVTQKFAKNWKILFSKAQYIRVTAQFSFNTIFLETPSTKF